MAALTMVLALSSALSMSSASPLTERATSNCRDVYFDLSATARNRVANNPPTDFSDVAATIAFLTQPVAFQQVSGPQKIYGQYCEPTTNNQARNTTLQLLVHGNSYDHQYFNAFDPIPSSLANSWAAYANFQGYPTLAIDRLCIGKSSHPDPVNVCQAPYQAELYDALITILRSSTKLSIPTNWKKIIWVGHSFGSILGTQISTNHPNAIDAFVQTGISIPTPDENPLPGELASGYVQASSYDPDRFPPAIYQPGYLVTSSKEGRANTFYSNPLADYWPALYDRDFDKKDTLALGEALTQDVYNSTSYANPVYVLTGKQDAVFCGNGSRLLGTPDCAEELPATKLFYPAVPASKFEYYAQPNARHCHQMHYTAALGFVKAHAFLTKMGF
ncbi:MAG: hypothetical protein Q9211_004665 [Gyalolechia sp. 1 TL-2023]